MKANHEAKRRAEKEENKYGNNQNEFYFLDEIFYGITEEIELNGKIIPVLSPSKYRKGLLDKPPTSIQGDLQYSTVASLYISTQICPKL